MIRQSEQIQDLASALSKAQGKITGALKDSTNPYFDSKYADLASVLQACREPLAENGLAIVQIPYHTDGKWILATRLTHSSGQWIEGDVPIIASQQNAQGFGSGMTYARRYGISAIVGVAQEDDDGNAAVGPRNGDDKIKAAHKAAEQKKAAASKAEDKKPAPRNESPITQGEAKQIFEAASKRLIKNEDVKEILKGLYGVDSTAQLKKYQFTEMLNLINSKDLSEIGLIIIERQSERMLNEEIK